MRMTIAALESHRLRAGRSLWASSAAGALGVLGLLAPKCPICLAAYLSAVGVSAGGAVLLSRLELPLCIALLVASLLGSAYFVTKRVRAARQSDRAHTPSCCGR